MRMIPQQALDISVVYQLDVQFFAMLKNQSKQTSGHGELNSLQIWASACIWQETGSFGETL